jgi:hypothetical protein
MEEFCLSSAGNKNTISAYKTSSQILIYGLRTKGDAQSIIRAINDLGFILSYQLFLFVWLNFQLDKSEFGEHKREVIPTNRASGNYSDL